MVFISKKFKPGTSCGFRPFLHESSEASVVIIAGLEYKNRKIHGKVISVLLLASKCIGKQVEFERVTIMFHFVSIETIRSRTQYHKERNANSNGQNSFLVLIST